MPPISRRVGHYHTFPEMSELMAGWADEYPAIAELSSIGKTENGRDLWLLTLTDKSTGPHHTKPAFWCLSLSTHQLPASARARVTCLLTAVLAAGATATRTLER